MRASLRLIVLSLAFGLCPATVAAAPADEQAAEAAFQRGLADMLAGRYATACPAIADSLRLDRRPGTLFTLAECEAKAGLVASARGHYQEFLGVLESLPADRRERQRERERIARTQAAGLAARAPTLILRLPDDAPATVVVKRNDAIVDPAVLGTPVAVDPGRYELRVEDAGGEATRQAVTVAEGEHRELLLRVPQSRPIVIPPAVDTTRVIRKAPPPGPPVPLLDEDRARRWRRWGATVAGTGVAVAALGGVSLLFARGKVHAIDAAAARGDPYDPSNGNYTTFQVAGYAMVAAGAAALIGGTVWYLLGRRGVLKDYH